MRWHAQKPDFIFRRNRRVHLNRRGRQFSRLLAAVCASAVVMLDTPCSEVVWRVLATHSTRQFPLHFPSSVSPCAITFQLDPTSRWWGVWSEWNKCKGKSEKFGALWLLKLVIQFISQPVSSGITCVLFLPTTPGEEVSHPRHDFSFNFLTDEASITICVVVSVCGNPAGGVTSYTGWFTQLHGSLSDLVGGCQTVLYHGAWPDSTPLGLSLGRVVYWWYSCFKCNSGI
jgi:hypothetical protein